MPAGVAPLSPRGRLAGASGALAVLGLAALGAPAAAQDSGAARPAGEGRVRLAQATPATEARAPRPAAAPIAAPASAATTTVRLIELLIQNGVLTRDQADSLLRQAQAEAAAAARAAPRAAPLAVPGAADAAVPPGTVRVPYVPETVRRQIRDEVTRDVLTQIRPQGPVLADGATAGRGAAGAAPGSAWTDRLRIYGDLRVRLDTTTFPSGNAAGFFPNFARINNSSSGFDLAGTDNADFLNVTEDRTRFRLRARLGVEARLNDWMTADLRLATGNDSSPVSTNQTFGAVSSSAQQFGSFSRYAIWLDRAYLRMKPWDWLQVDVGRMPNPFRSTDLIYDEDLNFDGIAARAQHRVLEDVTAYITAGAFPYYNTDFNFSSTDVAKTPSRDRYMVGAQAGVDWRFAESWNLGLNLGYYNFIDARGAVSSPCAVPFGADACDTDISRAFFTQNTNTFFPVRNLQTDPNNPLGPQPQYFGLASRFEILDLYTRISYAGYAPILFTVEGNYVNNLGFSRSSILSRGLLLDGEPNGIANNVGAGNRFVGGNQGYLLRLTVGHREPDEPWAWNVFFTYRYLESDAVLDALNDSDFRLGGTNSKGYILGGAVGLARNVMVRARYFSGQEVAGPSFEANTFLLDLQGRF
jgi:hypothetical protein